MTMPGTGELEQLTPDVEQIVDGESQRRTRPPADIITLEQPEKRTAPPPTTPRPPLPAEGIIAEEAAIQAIYGVPQLVWDRLAINSKEWRELIRWNVPVGFKGDLHSLGLQSDNDEKTRWRIVLGNLDQNVPADRQLDTPVSFPYDRVIIPGGSGCWVEVLSYDGTTIHVSAALSGTIR